MGFATVRSEPSSASLVIDLIDCARLDVRAVGVFGGDQVESVAQRLDQLVSGGPVELRVDAGRMTCIDPDVAALFVRAARRLDEAGGSLDVVGASGDVASYLLGISDASGLGWTVA